MAAFIARDRSSGITIIIHVHDVIVFSPSILYIVDIHDLFTASFVQTRSKVFEVPPAPVLLLQFLPH